MAFFRGTPFRACFTVWLSALPVFLLATEDRDFSVRVTGGGTFCAGETVPVDVYADFNLTGQNTQPIRGYSLAVCSLPHQVMPLEAQPGDSLNPETGTEVDFLQLNVLSRGIVQAVIVDLQTDRGLPPVNDLHLISAEYKVIDGATPARITPCSGQLGTPPVTISFSTGSQNYFPPEDIWQETAITSPCVENRIFHLECQVEAPLTFQCDTGVGTTRIRFQVREEPVFCCPPRLVRALSFALRLPDSLGVVRCYPGDVMLAGQRITQSGTLFRGDITYMAGARFGEAKTAVVLELATIPTAWKDHADSETLSLTFEDQGGTGVDTGVVYLDGATEAFRTLAQSAFSLTVAPHCPVFIRGDVNTDGAINLADAIALLSWLYKGENFVTPGCQDACDANDDGKLDIGDAIFVLNNIFNEGDDFPAPHTTCGRDPTGDNLDCARSPFCNP